MTLLTPRELDIFKLILDGKSDWEIALLLELSAKTVNYHVENAKRKLDASTRIRAVALALRDGLIMFPSAGSTSDDRSDTHRAQRLLRAPPFGQAALSSASVASVA
jgi:DNA-binding CsgD family transcriptional regulator